MRDATQSEAPAQSAGNGYASRRGRAREGVHRTAGGTNRMLTARRWPMADGAAYELCDLTTARAHVRQSVQR
jgi:hypothetical protein